MLIHYQTYPLYSVGQHSVFVSYLLFTYDASFHIDEALVGLFHDGSEGIGLRDIPSPLKKLELMKAYVEKEEEIQKLIYEAMDINITGIRWDRIKAADLEARSYEKIFLHGEWVEGFKPKKQFVTLITDIMIGLH